MVQFLMIATAFFYIACTFFNSHVMGCIDVNDTVQTVRQQSSVI